MPEFRFRRKKSQNRRTTVCNVEETARQIEAAKSLIETSTPESEPQSPVKTSGVGAGQTNGLSNGYTNGLSGSSKESMSSATNGEDPVNGGGEQPEQEDSPSREHRDEALLFAASSRGCRKRSSFVQEREMFLELLKAKYPEQACTLDIGMSNSEEGVGVAGAGDLSIFKDKPVVSVRAKLEVE